MPEQEPESLLRQFMRAVLSRTSPEVNRRLAEVSDSKFFSMPSKFRNQPWLAHSLYRVPAYQLDRSTISALYITSPRYSAQKIAHPSIYDYPESIALSSPIWVEWDQPQNSPIERIGYLVEPLPNGEKGYIATEFYDDLETNTIIPQRNEIFSYILRIDVLNKRYQPEIQKNFEPYYQDDLQSDREYLQKVHNLIASLLVAINRRAPLLTMIEPMSNVESRPDIAKLLDHGEVPNKGLGKITFDLIDGDPANKEDEILALFDRRVIDYWRKNTSTQIATKPAGTPTLISQTKGESSTVVGGQRSGPEITVPPVYLNDALRRLAKLRLARKGNFDMFDTRVEGQKLFTPDEAKDIDQYLRDVAQQIRSAVPYQLIPSRETSWIFEAASDELAEIKLPYPQMWIEIPGADRETDGIGLPTFGALLDEQNDLISITLFTGGPYNPNLYRKDIDTSRLEPNTKLWRKITALGLFEQSIAITPNIILEKKTHRLFWSNDIPCVPILYEVEGSPKIEDYSKALRKDSKQLDKFYQEQTKLVEIARRVAYAIAQKDPRLSIGRAFVPKSSADSLLIDMGKAPHRKAALVFANAYYGKEPEIAEVVEVKAEAAAALPSAETTQPDDVIQLINKAIEEPVSTVASPTSENDVVALAEDVQASVETSAIASLPEETIDEQQKASSEVVDTDSEAGAAEPSNEQAEQITPDIVLTHEVSADLAEADDVPEPVDMDDLQTQSPIVEVAEQGDEQGEVATVAVLPSVVAGEEAKPNIAEPSNAGNIEAEPVVQLTVTELAEKERVRLAAFNDAKERLLAEAEIYLLQAQNDEMNKFDCQIVMDKPGFPIRLHFEEQGNNGSGKPKKQITLLAGYASAYSERGAVLTVDDVVDLKIAVQSRIFDAVDIMPIHAPAGSGQRALEMDTQMPTPIRQELDLKGYSIIQRGSGVYALRYTARDPYTRRIFHPTIPLGVAARREDEVAEKMEVEARAKYVFDLIESVEGQRTTEGYRVHITKRDVMSKFRSHLKENNKEWITYESVTLPGFEKGNVLYVSQHNNQKITMAQVSLRMDAGGDNPSWHAVLAFHMGDKNTWPMGEIVRTFNLNLHTNNEQLAIARTRESLLGVIARNGDQIVEGFITGLQRKMRSCGAEWYVADRGTAQENVMVGSEPLQYFFDDMMRYENDIGVSLVKRELDAKGDTIITLQAQRAFAGDFGGSVKPRPENVYETIDEKRAPIAYSLRIRKDKSDLIDEFIQAAHRQLRVHSGEAYTSVVLEEDEVAQNGDHVVEAPSDALEVEENRQTDKRKKPLEYRTAQVRNSFVGVITPLYEKKFGEKLPRNWQKPEVQGAFRESVVRTDGGARYYRPQILCSPFGRTTQPHRYRPGGISHIIKYG